MRIVGFIIGFFVVLSPAMGQELNRRVNTFGVPKYLELSPQNNKVVFWAYSEGNSSIPLGVKMVGPKQLKIVAKAKRVKSKGLIQQALSEKKNWYRVKLKTQEQFDHQKSQCSRISFGEQEEIESNEENVEDYPEIENVICDEIGPDYMQQIATQLGITYGGTWTIGNTCAYIVKHIDESEDGISTLPGAENIEQLGRVKKKDKKFLWSLT